MLMFDTIYCYFKIIFCITFYYNIVKLSILSTIILYFACLQNWVTGQPLLLVFTPVCCKSYGHYWSFYKNWWMRHSGWVFFSSTYKIINELHKISTSSGSSQTVLSVTPVNKMLEDLTDKEMDIHAFTYWTKFESWLDLVYIDIINWLI